MKLGLCLEMVYTQRPFEERLKKAAQLGFQYVEMWFTDATYKGTPEALAQAGGATGRGCHQHGNRLARRLLGGGLTDPGKREQWLARARATFDFNQRAGIPATIVCTGNLVPGLSAAQMERSVLDGLRATAELAEKAGITLLLEVLNTTYDHPGYWLTSSDAGAALCRQVGSDASASCSTIATTCRSWKGTCSTTFAVTWMSSGMSMRRACPAATSYTTARWTIAS